MRNESQSICAFLALVLSGHICFLYTLSTFMMSESVTMPRKSLSPDIRRVCRLSGVTRGFFTIASNTPGPEASQL